MSTGPSWLSRLFGGGAGGAGRFRRRGFFSGGVRRGNRSKIDLGGRRYQEGVDADLVPGPRLAPVRSWAYQLQGISAETVAKCDADVVVIDSSSDGSVAGMFKAEDIARMKARPGGGSKKIICYMSIGEAEEQRFYWDSSWVRNRAPSPKAPSWLADLNGEGWEGNFKVKFWDPAWQAIIIDRPDSFLNQIVRVGFDGVYLDIIDAYDFWMDSDRGRARRPTADAEMVAFVRRIASHARDTLKKRDFAVVPQNGEPLLKYPEYRAAISAIGKEDILYRMTGKANRTPQLAANDKDEVAKIISDVRLAVADRIPVLAVEYLRDRDTDAKKIPDALRTLRSYGLVPHFGKRLLGELSPVETPVPSGPALA